MPELAGQTSMFDLGIWSGKTYPEHSAPTVAKISAPSLKKRQGSAIKMPLFLDLRDAGRPLGASWEEGGALLGVYTMHSFGECPSVVRESRLSQILEEQAHPKYSLSARACQGILNRAERRGKELPKELKESLEAQCLSKNEQGNQWGAKESSCNRNGQEPCQPSTTSPYAFKPRQSADARSLGGGSGASPNDKHGSELCGGLRCLQPDDREGHGSDRHSGCGGGRTQAARKSWPVTCETDGSRKPTEPCKRNLGGREL